MKICIVICVVFSVVAAQAADVSGNAIARVEQMHADLLNRTFDNSSDPDQSKQIRTQDAFAARFPTFVEQIAADPQNPTNGEKATVMLYAVKQFIIDIRRGQAGMEFDSNNAASRMAAQDAAEEDVQ